MRKIHIIGAPGSGKTTLAQDISSRLHIPHYELECMDWEREKLIAVAEQPAWITEGIFLIITEPMLYHADCIVLLEVSWPVAAWRMLRRHIWNSLRGQQRYPGIDGIRSLIKLMKDTRRYILNVEHGIKPPVDALFKYLETHQEESEPPTEGFLQTYIEIYGELIIPPTEEFVRLYLERYKQKLYLIRNAAERERFLTFATQKG